MEYADLKTKLARVIETEKDYVQRAIAELADDPTRVARSYPLFEAVAKVQVYQECLAVAEKFDEPVFRAWLIERLTEKARTVEQSTSPTSNLYNDYVRASFAKVASANWFSL